MTVKEYLHSIGRLNQEILALEDCIVETETRLSHITPILSDMPAYHSGGDKITDGIAKIIELKAKLNDKIDRVCQLQVEIMDYIDLISNTAYRIILTDRYFNHRSFEQISVRLNYSYYETIRMHGRALQEFDKVKSAQDSAT